jgi:hypothetical protein
LPISVSLKIVPMAFSMLVRVSVSPKPSMPVLAAMPNTVDDDRLTETPNMPGWAKPEPADMERSML